ncbi:MAG: isoprenylcysteine carboxylmethyltransferase family protein, partial [Planctomycetota bacterium]
MKRWAILTYGILAYLMFFGVFLYSILFIGNLWIPRSLDSAATMAALPALGINVGLLTLFAVQHSGMAR